MRLDDNLIISHLDNEWRTAPAVHRLLGERGAVADIAYALERLARAGKIEAKGCDGCPYRKSNPLAVDRESGDAAARCLICAN